MDRYVNNRDIFRIRDTEIEQDELIQNYPLPIENGYKAKEKWWKRMGCPALNVEPQNYWL